MSDISDEFSTFDFSEFTEEDFQRIDADVASKVVTVDGGPSLAIELELEPLPVNAESGHSLKLYDEQQTGLSPCAEFRSGGVFSVTDLATPSWCEVQFDYGLRQKRSRPIASRPKTFRSAQGKEISVKESVALKNDETTKQGKAIHKELEREIRLEELQVDISSNEERWALRLVNMLVCLKILLTEGKIREMPVFGIVQDQLIVGIIDEIDKRPQGSYHTDILQLSPKMANGTPSSPKTSTSEFLPSTATDLGASRDYFVFQNMRHASFSSQQHILHLVDTKTRRSNTLPLFEDTLPSRIQLMLYHRLLKELMSVSEPFNFTYLWDRLHLRSSETFSTRFLVQAGLLVENSTFPMTSLDGLAKTWAETVQQAQVTTVDPNLTIIYRLQSHLNSKGKGKMRARDTIAELGITLEERDLARAIEASLSDTLHNSASNLVDSAAQSPADAEIGLDTMIIGTKEFIYNEDFLDKHLAHILRWWHGHRKPEGVSLQNSRRCFSCEYESHCEWREQKAAEFRERLTRQVKP
ncbi:exonuclease V [Collybia nuda]|uniref:Exonuclease V n=1 Tax=Collybia nuda TaxID=64659 RepID=A0A9P5YL22_9AGAR|nr:exonuclease V [Collybia nuda]